MLSDQIIAAAAELAASLRHRGQSVTTVESCTGGLISAAITAVPGSSEYYPGGFVTYSNEQKQRMVGVSAATIESHGAVSPQTAIEMARGGRARTDADYAIAVSGVAGPGGGSSEKPVGTVWLCVAGPDGMIDCRRFLFPGERSQICERSVITAMRLLVNLLAGIDQALADEQSRHTA